MNASPDHPDPLPGYSFGEQLPGEGVFGKIWNLQDQRLEGRAAERIVRLIPCPGDAGWRPALLDRLHRLNSESIPHLSVPLETGTSDDDHVYVVSHRFPRRLWDEVAQDKGLEPSRAKRIIEHLLRALAGLHDNRLPHGDVRLRKLHLVSPDSERETAWLVDADVGSLTSLSENGLLDENARFYYDPDWKGRPGQPTNQADLFAAGLVAVEILLGKSANPLRRDEQFDDEDPPDTDIVTAVLPRLKQAGIDASTRDLISTLLASDPDKRPPNAGAALKQWQSDDIRDARRPVIGVAVAALSLMVIAGIWTVLQFSSQADKLHTTIAERASMKASHKTTIDARDTTIKNLINVIENLPGTQPTPTPPLEEWRTMLNSASFKPLFDKLVMDYTAAYRQAPEEHRTAFVSAIKQLKEAMIPRDVKPIYISAWLGADGDKEAQRLFQKAINDPWTTDPAKTLHARLLDLQKAAVVWDERAKSSNPSLKHARKIFQGEEPRVKSILDMWIADLLKHEEEDKWFVRPLVSDTPAGSWGLMPVRKGRMLQVYINEPLLPQVDYVHYWEDWSHHAYSNNDNLYFSWSPGQSLGLRLQARQPWWYTVDYDLIEHYLVPFRGPLAVWLARKQRRIRQSDLFPDEHTSPATLEFDVGPHFGPPPEVIP